MQNNKGVWLPIIASVGVGAATYYTMTKNNSNIGEAVQKMIPIVASMGNNGQLSGMQQMQQNGSQQNQGQQYGNNQNQDQQSGQLGPFGMA